MSWTPEMIAEMTSLTHAGWSTSRIAEKLSETAGRRITRNAVIGKAGRVNLALNSVSAMVREARRDKTRWPASVKPLDAKPRVAGPRPPRRREPKSPASGFVFTPTKGYKPSRILAPWR